MTPQLRPLRGDRAHNEDVCLVSSEFRLRAAKAHLATCHETLMQRGPDGSNNKGVVNFVAYEVALLFVSGVENANPSDPTAVTLSSVWLQKTTRRSSGASRATATAFQTPNPKH